MLTKVTDIIDTCKEETIDEIRCRYVEYNEHGQSYVWKVRYICYLILKSLSNIIDQSPLHQVLVKNFSLSTLLHFVNNFSSPNIYCSYQ